MYFFVCYVVMKELFVDFYFLFFSKLIIELKNIMMMSPSFICFVYIFYYSLLFFVIKKQIGYIKNCFSCV
jgi:hypothetical protein